MATAVNTMLVEGVFEDQVLELAEYFDNLRPDEASLVKEITPMVEKGEKEDAMEKLVEASSILSSAPEKGLLLIQLLESLSSCSLTIWVTSVRLHPSIQPTRSLNAKLTASTAIRRHCHHKPYTAHQVVAN